MPRSRLPPILAATIATLPRQPPFSAEQREAFFAMLHCAIDVAYGPVETRSAEGPKPTDPPPIDPRVLFPGAPTVTWQQPRRYIIDHDGFAMCVCEDNPKQNKPVKFTEAPPGAVFHDLRTDDTGNTATILWHDCGARLDGAMPAGATLHF
jgi:hypothetical protein